MGEAVYGSTAAGAGAPGGAMVVQERLRISGKVVRSLGRLPAAQDKSGGVQDELLATSHHVHSPALGQL